MPTTVASYPYSDSPINRCQDDPMHPSPSSLNKLASANISSTMDPANSMQESLPTCGQPNTDGLSLHVDLTQSASIPNHSPSNSSLHPTPLKPHKMVTLGQTCSLKPKQPLSLSVVTWVSLDLTRYSQAAKDKN